jgi:outer membrane biosynthesis protein TonB
MSLPPDHPPTLPSDRDYQAGLKWSVGLHVVVLVLVLLKSFVFPGNPIPYVPTLRVDVVGLPDILKKDLKNVPSTKEVSEILKKAEQEARRIKPKPLPPMPKPKEIAQPDEMAMKPIPTGKLSKKAEKEREKRLKAALARMKAMAKISNEERKSAPLIKGNKISKGDSLAGDAKESDQSNYYDSVLQRLQENWALPVWLSRQNLSAQVQVFIDARGRLHGFRFVKGSGNPQFDDAVKRTLQESSPFSSPPSALSGSVLVNGIIFGFPL